MPKMKYYDGEKWYVFDAANAETVGGKRADEFAPATHIGSGGNVHKVAIANGEAGFLSGADKAKLDDVEKGAQKNQSAFSQVKVGADIIPSNAPDGILELVAGANITVTPNVLSRKITIAAAVDAIDATTPGGTEANKIAKTNASGRVGDAERIAGKSLYELDLRYSAAGTGGGGVAAGDGEAVFGQEVDTSKIVTATASVKIPIASFDITKHILFVFQNGTFIQHGKEYTINTTTGSINKISGTWAAGTTFDFVLMKVTSSGDMLKVGQYESYAKATAGQTVIPINIPGFIAGLDGLNVYHKGLRLSFTNHFTLDSAGTSIVLKTAAAANDEFQFVVVKKEKINP